MEHITFINTLNVSERYKPQPASTEIPSWYKDLSSYYKDEKTPVDGKSSGTIKRCMPVFDVIVSGYIIYSYTDISVSTRSGQPFYEWPSFGPLEFHPIWQAPNHPDNNGHKISYPKWINSWAIKTPKGYSCLFIPPVHRESNFSILPGVVDTDKYTIPVNFPFVLKNPSYTGIIPAGTPIAQVIPFKRTAWTSSFEDKKNLKNQDVVTTDLTSKFFDSYKNLFRQVKEYK